MSSTTRRLCVAAAVILAAGVAGWFLVDGAVDTPRPRHGGGSPPPSASSEMPGEAPPTPSSAHSRTAKQQIVPSASSRGDDAPTLARTAATVRVYVYDHATGAPIAGAEVAASAAASLPRVQTNNFFSRTSSSTPPATSLFDLATERAITDSAGKAVVERKNGLIVASRRGELFGWKQVFGTPGNEVRVPMIRSWPIAARVVSEDGAPVPGIPVVLRRIYDVSHVRGLGEEVIVTSREPDGLAVLRMWSVGAPATGTGDVLRAWIKGYEVNAVEAPLHELERGPLTLRLPPMASLRVMLKDADGRPFRDPARVYVGAGPFRPGADRQGLVPEPSIDLEAIDAVASFPKVPIGIPLTVVALAESCEPAVVDLAPMAVAAVTESVNLQLASRRAVLSGRIVDDQGAVLASRHIRIVTVTRNPAALTPQQRVVRSEPRRMESDRDGSFRVDAPARATARQGARLEIEIVDAAGDLTHVGALDVPALADGAETPLGDVEVSARSVLVAGRVRDDHGSPLAGVKVIAHAQGLTARVEALTDASGAFSIPVPASASGGEGKVEFVVVTTELMSEFRAGGPQYVPPGKTDLVVVLAATGAIEGAVIPPADLPMFRLRMTVSGGALRNPASFEDCVDSEARFRLDGLPPGSFTLGVYRPGQRDPLVSLPGIEVPRLGVSSDPRLQSIDLRP
jgi:hypothetical protein